MIGSFTSPVNMWIDEISTVFFVDIQLILQSLSHQKEGLKDICNGEKWKGSFFPRFLFFFFWGVVGGVGLAEFLPLLAADNVHQNEETFPSSPRFFFWQSSCLFQWLKRFAKTIRLSLVSREQYLEKTLIRNLSAVRLTLILEMGVCIDFC